jgi:ABC-2 type transport system ATP-binding protein
MLDDPKRAKAQIGYLPEHPPLYRELTVDEYVD